MASIGISVVLALVFTGDRTVKPAAISTIYIAFPSFLIAVLHFAAGITITDCIEWVYVHPLRYMLISMMLCLSGTVGGFLDAKIALYKYKRAEGKNGLSKKQIYRIVKFGGDVSIERGTGVYDLSRGNILYGIISNITGAMCPISMLMFIRTLPGYLDYLKNTYWIDYYSLLGTVMVVPALLQYLSMQKSEYPESIDSSMDNPDNYSMNRLHVILNALSLWFTNTMVMVLGFTYYSYSITNIWKNAISTLFILPLFALMVFLAHLAFSSVAITHKAVNVGAYRIGLKTVIGIIITSLLLHRFSMSTVIIAIFSVGMVAAWNVLANMVENKTVGIKKWKYATMWITVVALISLIAVTVTVALQELYR